MRGRKPLPTDLAEARGNPSRRPLNKDAPKYQPAETACPDALTDPVAREEWNRIIDDLVKTGHITKVDRATLIGYCAKYAQWQALEVEARKHAFIVKAPSGYPIPNPALSQANKAFRLMLTAAAELGLTPSSRSRVIATPNPESSDAFEAFQRSKPQIVRVK